MTAPPIERDRTIYLDLKRRQRAERASRAGDLLAALTLLFTAVPLIVKSPSSSGFAYVEVVAAAGLLYSVLKEMKSTHGAHHPAPGWTEMFSAIILIIDSVRKFESGPRHYPLATTYAALSVFILLKGYLIGRLIKRRFLSFDAEGIKGRTARVRRFNVSWSDVSGLSANLNTVVFQLKNGGQARINLSAFHNAREVADEIVARAVSKGIGVRAESLNDCAPLPAS